jgi:cytochrome c heme-lyase
LLIAQIWYSLAGTSVDITNMWPFTSSTDLPSASALNVSTNAEASSSKLPAQHPSTAGSADQCPVDHTTRSAWLAANANSPHPFTPESESQPTTTRQGLISRLSNDRVVSSIPRASSSPDQPSPEPSLPYKPNPSKPSYTSQDGGHEGADGKWVYPSEQQFFNAMLRKNHKPQARDMRTIVPIHNAVNEKAWEQVLMYEAGMGADRCGGPRLVSFVGRPKDRTPKAWVMTALG